ncbi:uncharacterized protein C13orf46 homolog isoform X5 [Sminthopsis crassicaudata]|uniref:uncharacterized protein C13orf46 homolog isoform X5 n=1 Tax=Sminthopsis crassicaudata TaxID=9301 RepID=UPI003D69E6C9
MEKETVHRRHRLITGVPPTVMAPGLHKGVTEASELQRSKSVGGFPPKGEPVAPIEKLLQEFGEDLDKESKGEAEDISCQIILEDDKDGQEQGDLKRVDQDKDKDKDKEKVEKEVEKKEEEEQIKTDQDEDKRVKEKENSVLELNSTQTLEKELQALKLDDLLLDTETNLAKIENTLTEEKSSKAEAGDMSEDESKTMWICCFPISTKKKSKEKA